MHINIPIEELVGLMLEVFESGGQFSFLPRGTSMLPLLRQDIDTVTVKAPEAPSKGDIILYRRKNGKYVLHRIIGSDKNGFILCGDNQFVREHGITNESIIAVAERIDRGGTVLELSSPTLIYRLYRFFLPLRRFYCAVPRRMFYFLKKTIRKSGGHNISSETK